MAYESFHPHALEIRRGQRPKVDLGESFTRMPSCPNTPKTVCRKRPYSSTTRLSSYIFVYSSSWQVLRHSLICLEMIDFMLKLAAIIVHFCINYTITIHSSDNKFTIIMLIWSHTHFMELKQDIYMWVGACVCNLYQALLAFSPCLFRWGRG